jgi:hypothetical protein
MKTPGTTKAEPSAPNSRKFTPRQFRVLSALTKKLGKWIWREDIDAIAGASNGPEIISQLRHGRGIDIQMEKVANVDRDGMPCNPGRYRMTDKGLAALHKLGWV